MKRKVLIKEIQEYLEKEESNAEGVLEIVEKYMLPKGQVFLPELGTYDNGWEDNG